MKIRPAAGKFFLVCVLIAPLYFLPRCSSPFSKTAFIDNLSEITGSVILDDQQVMVYGQNQTGSLEQSVAEVYWLDLAKKSGQEVYSGPGWVVRLQSAGQGMWYGLTRQYLKEDAYVERVIKSSDNGQSWQTIHTFNDTAHTLIHSLFFTSPNEGWLFGYSDTLTTTDGGKSWQSHAPLLLSESGVCANDTNTAWAIEENKLIAINLTANNRRVVMETPKQSRLVGPACDLAGNLWYGSYTKSAANGPLNPKIFKLNLATQKETLVTDDLPDDFLLDQLLLSNHSLFVSGSHMKSASFFGISHHLFKIELDKTGSVKSINFPSATRAGLIGASADGLFYFEKDATRHGYAIYSFKSGL